MCPNHGSVRPLDIVKIILGSKCNDEDHPEDWNYDPVSALEFVARFDPQNLPALLINLIPFGTMGHKSMPLLQAMFATCKARLRRFI